MSTSPRGSSTALTLTIDDFNKSRWGVFVDDLETLSQQRRPLLAYERIQSFGHALIESSPAGQRPHIGRVAHYRRQIRMVAHPQEWGAHRPGQASSLKTAHDASEETAMGFIFFGLCGIVAGMLLVDVGDSPTTWDTWDVFSLLLMIAGAVAVLVGMVVHVVVNRGDR